MAKFNFNKTKLPVVYDKNGNGGYIVKLKDCSYGEFIRIVSKNGSIQNRVYTLDEYDKREKKYWCGAWDNIVYGRYLKGDTLVFVGFTF